MKTKHSTGRITDKLAIMGLLFSANFAAANTATVPVQVTFVEPITISEVKGLQFGYLDKNLANLERVTVTPNSAVADSADRIEGGSQAAASMTITATASQSITILVDNVSAATGYTLGTWMCNYDGAGSDSACDGAGYSATTVANATLKVGVTLTGNGSAVAGVDDSTFDVTITYE